MPILHQNNLYRTTLNQISMTTSKRVLIFDFDGVIADTIHVHVPIYNQLSHKYNLKPLKTPEEYSNIFDNNFYEALPGLGLPNHQVEDLLKDWKRLFLQEFNNMPLYPGIKDAISQLAQHNEVCIVTTNSSKILKSYLTLKEIKEFQTILGEEEDKSKVNKLNTIKSLHPSHDYYYITDTIGDIIEAKQAGVKSVAVTWGYQEKEKLAKENPDHIVDSVEELLSLF